MYEEIIGDILKSGVGYSEYYITFAVPTLSKNAVDIKEFSRASALDSCFILILKLTIS